MGMCPESSPNMFFPTGWDLWDESLVLLQRAIGDLSGPHPDDLMRPSLEIAEAIDEIGNNVVSLKGMLNADLDFIDESGAWNPSLADVWVNTQLEKSDFTNQFFLKLQARRVLANFSLMSELFSVVSLTQESKLDWETFESVRGQILPTVKVILDGLPEDFNPTDLLQVKGPTMSEYCQSAEGLESFADVGEDDMPGWMSIVNYIWSLKN